MIAFALSIFATINICESRASPINTGTSMPATSLTKRLSAFCSITVTSSSNRLKCCTTRTPTLPNPQTTIWFGAETINYQGALRLRLSSLSPTRAKGKRAEISSNRPHKWADFRKTSSAKRNIPFALSSDGCAPSRCADRRNRKVVPKWQSRKWRWWRNREIPSKARVTAAKLACCDAQHKRLYRMPSHTPI